MSNQLTNTHPADARTHAGHVWCTSLERLLLRFAGPAFPNAGCVLQQVDVTQVLPDYAEFYPMCVTAVGDTAGSQVLVVTAHGGDGAGTSFTPGVVAVLSCGDKAVQVVHCWQEPSMQHPNMAVVQRLARW